MYFEKFPQIYYEFDINGVRETRIVRDVTLNVRIRKAILENITLYDEYDIRDGETPEIISHKIYGSPLYHWVIMMVNERYDYINDFPMSSQEFERYVTDKYGSNTNLFATHHHVNAAGFIVNEVPGTTTPISNYDYELSVNESKRRIKLIAPISLGQVLQSFKSLM